MNFTIKSRKTGEIFSFYAPESGVYVHLESRDTLVTQVLRFAVVEGSWGVRFPVALLRTIWPVLPVNGTDSS
jgi:hypothetical protein